MTDLNGPRKDFPEGKWVEASPENVLGFGAVTFFFAREIYQKYKIPVGIINASVGGTPIEAWISESGLKDFSNLQATINQNKDTAYIAAKLEENRKNTIRRPNNDKGTLESPQMV